MSNAYTASHFPNHFFNNMKLLKKCRILNNSANTHLGSPALYLPFTLHFFTHIHGLNFAQEFVINYITTENLCNGDVNSLYSATNSSTFESYCKFNNTKNGEQQRLLIYKKATFYTN